MGPNIGICVLITPSFRIVLCSGFLGPLSCDDVHPKHGAGLSSVAVVAASVLLVIMKVNMHACRLISFNMLTLQKRNVYVCLCVRTVTK